MIVITGGVGMIGSVIARHLNNLGRDDLVIVDDIRQPEQWQNLVKRRYANYLDKSELACFLASKPNIDTIIHMGAISATTERDYNKLVQNNIRYSQLLWNWCAENKVRFLYASSAATYGAGEQGYDDACDINMLRPLNGYGYSKQYFDQWALQQVTNNQPAPPQWQGFKFFNVYGPNEYHKERMASVSFHTFNQFKAEGVVKLFKSHLEGYEDGMQLRDFVYVKDAASAVVHFVSNLCESGLYNVGTGQARAFKDLAVAVMTSMGKAPSITYTDMPEDLLGKYQYFTEAKTLRLANAGYTEKFHTLEEGVCDYVQNYLLQVDPYC